MFENYPLSRTYHSETWSASGANLFDFFGLHIADSCQKAAEADQTGSQGRLI